MRKDFQLWLNSCSTNKDFDFLVFTDNNTDEYNTPKNVKYITITIDDFKKILEKNLETKCNLDHNYKICDYRPMYGIALYQYIKGYDFWGYCDFDMIFGKLNHFITTEVLEEYDKVYYLGHLSLYKNKEIINELFKTRVNGISYIDICKSPKNNIFDESGGMIKILREKNIKTYNMVNYADIGRFTKRMNNVIDGSNFGAKNDKCVNYKHQIFVYENGHIFKYFLKDGSINREEYSYIHFSGRSYNPINNKNFIITPKKLIPLENNIQKNDIIKYNRRSLYIFENIYRIINKAFFKIKKRNTYEKLI